ncbi:hypothetical protein DUI87_18947 [Hirundo rustica rustica]|uniref:Uncharacterized protein n=1 Tax=Hirundo rustica rustica TaxID=333673 RepID=A0A3M0JWD4_HIRRU|nr:hypothetical protein DUI87_18947 [Hirundo rustica rustica]
MRTLPGAGVGAKSSGTLPWVQPPPEVQLMANPNVAPTQGPLEQETWLGFPGRALWMSSSFMGKGADKNCGGHFQIFDLCGHAAQGNQPGLPDPKQIRACKQKDTTENAIFFTGFTEKLKNTKITTEPANMQLMVHTEGFASYF